LDLFYPLIFSAGLGSEEPGPGVFGSLEPESAEKKSRSRSWSRKKYTGS